MAVKVLRIEPERPRMPDTPSITIVKVFPYRGVDEEFTNTYHFSGTTPADKNAWLALAGAIFTEEAKLMGPSVKFAGHLGYAAGNEHAVSVDDPRQRGGSVVPGTFTGNGNTPSGDQAVWVRWATPNFTSRGKRIYLRKYFHGVPISGDVVGSDWKTAAAAYGAKMTDGSLPGGFKICGPQGAVAGTVTVSQFSTTRTLKRRGRRPS